MKEKGTMIGIGAAYTYHNGVMIKVAGRYSYGQVDYQNSGTLNNIDEPIAKVLKREEFVIPTKVGIQSFQYVAKISGFPFARE